MMSPGVVTPNPTIRTTTKKGIVPIENKLRTRDFIAILMAILFTKMGWSSNTNNTKNTTQLTGSMNLRWYIPRHIDTTTTYNNKPTTTTTKNDISSLSTSTSRLVPAVLDIDGDGTSEALVTITQQHQQQSVGSSSDTNNEQQWKIQILDMKPIIVGYNKNSIDSKQATNANHNNNAMLHASYYRPIVMLESEFVSELIYTEEDNRKYQEEYDQHGIDQNRSSIVPIDFITSHVILRPDAMTKKKTTTTSTNDKNAAPTNTVVHDRTLQFFCGIDWHDASTKCAVHCPSGQSTDCPDGERCYADTPCTNKLNHEKDNHNNDTDTNDNNVEKLYHTTTPAGGWPSIFTLWSNGIVTMHSIVIDDDEEASSKIEEDDTNNQKRKKSKFFQLKYKLQQENNKKKLKVKLMWKSPIPLQLNNNNYSINENNKNTTTTTTKTQQQQQQNQRFLLYHWSNWNDVAIQYIDSITSNNGAGTIIVMGTATQLSLVNTTTSDEYKHGAEVDDDVEMNLNNNEMMKVRQMHHETFTVAYNVQDGSVLWKSISSEGNPYEQRIPPSGTSSEDPILASLTRGTTSAARRRSRIPGLSEFSSTTDSFNSSSSSSSLALSRSNCLREYRYSILTSSVLPHGYFSEDDAEIQALHFDHQGGNKNSRHSTTTAAGAKGGKPKNQQLGSLAQIGRKTTADKRKRRRTQASGIGSNTKGIFSFFSSSSSSKSKKKNSSSDPLRFGRPNVVVLHNRAGIQVKSLKNGRPLCHLSLPEGLVYADVNHDGTIDSLLSIVTDSELTQYFLGEDEDDAESEAEMKKKVEEGEPWNDAALTQQDQINWIKGLARRIQQSADSSSSNQKKQKKKNKQEREEEEDQIEQAFESAGSATPLCHLLGLSGIPAKEELFSIDICGYSKRKGKKKKKKLQQPNHEGLMGTQPLVVEPFQRGNQYKGRAIVTALNNGIVTRIRASNGRKDWQVSITSKMLSPIDGAGIIPTWDDPALVTLQRINVKNVAFNKNDVDDYEDINDPASASAIAPAHRPILWTGEGSMVLLSATRGEVMSYASFPQPALARPVLTDFNGDGTSDVIVITTDAVWGYQVKVHASTSVFFRLIWGFLLLAFMVALLRNQFQEQPGKRSTDRQ